MSFTPAVNTSGLEPPDVEISFADEQLRTQCNSDGKEIRRRFGQKVAKALQKRLDDLAAVRDLTAAYCLPGKLHSLQRDLVGSYAMRLDGGYRLIFQCAHDPPPLNADGAIDPNRVTAICIARIEDYHD